MKQKYKVIALDLDDVIVDTAEHVIEHYNNSYGTSVRLADYYADGQKSAHIWGVDDIEVASERINKFTLSDEFNSPVPTIQAVNALKELAKRYKLYIVTGRNARLMEVVTNRWIDQYLPHLIEEVIFTSLYEESARKNKGNVCLEIEADLLIDDHLGHIFNAAACGVDGLLFGNFPWGKTTEKLPKNVERAKDWAEVLEFLDGK